MISGDRALAEGKRGAFYNTLEEFHTHWERIDIICPSAKSYKLQATSYFGNVFIHPSPWPLLFQPLWIVRQGLRILKDNSYKLSTKSYLMTVHEYPPFYNGLGARWLHAAIGIPYVLEIMHIPGFPHAGNLKETLYRMFMRWFIAWDAAPARAVRVINKKETPEFLKRAGVPAEKLVYIPAFYIDLEVFKPLELPKEYDLIFVGRLEKNKGIELFLEAVRFLNRRALIVGDGSLRKSIKDEVDSEKLPVKLHGWAKDSAEVAQLINQSRILVMPSYNEGGPRVVLEAMACGVPVISTRVGIAADIIRNGENGFLVGWGSEDLSNKIKTLLQDQSLRDLFSAAGQKIARMFERKTMIARYAEQVQRLIS